MHDDPFDLQRFVDAQADVYAQVCDELRDGRKASHWMWFVFPQLRGLGHSAMATRYGLTGLDEARAYLRHRLLGPRLEECTALVLRVQGRSIHQILGAPDDLKFCSCMTLFQRAAPDATLFGEALRRHFDGAPDLRTLQLLRSP